MPNGKRVEKFRENAKFTEQDVSKHLKTVTDVKVLQADGLIPVKMSHDFRSTKKKLSFSSNITSNY